MEIIFVGCSYYCPTHVISGVFSLYASLKPRQFAHAKVLKFIVCLLKVPMSGF